MLAPKLSDVRPTLLPVPARIYSIYAFLMKLVNWCMHIYAQCAKLHTLTCYDALKYAYRGDGTR